MTVSYFVEFTRKQTNVQPVVKVGGKILILLGIAKIMALLMAG
jgi:hypothetical protein